MTSVSHVTEIRDADASTIPATKGQRHLALAAVPISAGIFGAVLPYVQTPLIPIPAFIPILESVLTTAVLAEFMSLLDADLESAEKAIPAE